MATVCYLCNRGRTSLIFWRLFAVLVRENIELSVAIVCCPIKENSRILWQLCAVLVTENITDFLTTVYCSRKTEHFNFVAVLSKNEKHYIFCGNCVLFFQKRTTQIFWPPSTVLSRENTANFATNDLEYWTPQVFLLTVLGRTLIVKSVTTACCTVNGDYSKISVQ